jgi:hypothetical protein
MRHWRFVSCSTTDSVITPSNRVNNNLNDLTTMLPDPLMLSSFATADIVTNGDLSHTLTNPFRTTDVAPGRTNRIGTISGNPAVLTIAGTQSNENKGTLTDRYAVKLSVRKNVEDVGPVSASVQVTLAFPRAGFSSAELKDLSSMLFTRLYYNSEGAVDSAVIDRVLTGEP